MRKYINKWEENNQQEHCRMSGAAARTGDFSKKCKKNIRKTEDAEVS